MGELERMLGNRIYIPPLLRLKALERVVLEERHMGLTPNELRLLLDVVSEEAERSQDLYLMHADCDDSCSHRDRYRTRSEKAQLALDLIERELMEE